jgi:hypothetical protein
MKEWSGVESTIDTQLLTVLPTHMKQRGLMVNEGFTVSFFDEACRVSFDGPVDTGW